MKTVSLDLHDFSVLNNRLDLLLKLKEHYPDMKVSVFTIPWDFPFELGQGRMYRKKTLAEIKKHLDWIQIIPHGVCHFPREFQKASREATEKALTAIDDMFTQDGLPYEKGFAAPYWLWNQDVVDVLNEHGWWGAIDRNQPQMLKTKRTYTYSHSLEEPFWTSDEDTLKLHGHMAPPSANNLPGAMLNLLKLDPDVEWKFVTEFIE